MAEVTTDSIPMVPQEWPGAFGLYKHSKQAVKFNLGTIGCLIVASIAVSMIAELDLGFVGQALSFVGSSLVSASMTLVYLASVRKGKLSFDESLKKGWSFLVKVMLFSLLGVLIGLVSLLLFIIPFFIIMPRLALANYYLIDKNTGVVESFKTSWAASRGHAGKVWGIFGVNLLMFLLCVTIIGIPFAIYMLIMYSAATAVLYEYIGKYNANVTKA